MLTIDRNELGGGYIVPIKIPFSTLKIANEAGIPCKIRRSRLLTCLKMLYISATLKFF